MRVNHTLLLAFYILFGTTYSATWAAAPLSKYGTIQNVQTYSSNPFWTPDAPYNQRMPTPVYATGTDIETVDCQRVTHNLVAAICATMNNCATATLSDVRPTLITQMSRMPGGNYATACAGYLDTAFSDYVRTHSHAGAHVIGATFPAATTPNPNTSDTIDTNVFSAPQPEWAAAKEQREQNLQRLSNQGPTAFPATYDDLSFSDRMHNAADGYKPFQDSSAYKPITINATTSVMGATSGPAAKPTPDSTATGTSTPPKPVLSNNPTETVTGEILFIL